MCLHGKSILALLKRGDRAEADLADGGSDKFIDAMVLLGDAATIARGLTAHLQAGANQVCIQPVHAEGDSEARDRTLSAPPFDPALDSLLASLHGHYKMAVVSSSSRTEIEPLLQAGGLRHYFETMVCDREAGALKPAPEPYLMAARLLGASNPLVVEDSPAGIASGRAAGFEVLAVQSPAEVPELVRRKVARAHGMHHRIPLDVQQDTVCQGACRRHAQGLAGETTFSEEIAFS